ncbi:MAG TPA: hypothetical protein VFA04_22540, partial [Bryobacteraceae bacterium]|nr:hypothetical protein [Bryobacteraceae bacterium]
AHLLVLIVASVVFANSRCLASCDALRGAAAADCCHGDHRAPSRATHVCAVDLTATVAHAHAGVSSPLCRARVYVGPMPAFPDLRTVASYFDRDNGPPADPVIRRARILRI